MRSKTIGFLVALCVGLTASVALAAGAASDRSGPPRASECKNATEPVAELTGGALRKTIFCLLNDRRDARGLDPLKHSDSLESAAQKHTETMVATDCLGHLCGSEPDLQTRIERAGYLKGATSFSYAENTGCGVSADAMVANWMASRFHRVNILAKKYEDLGVGYSSRRVPSLCAQGYGTFTTVFGFRDG